MDFFLKDSDEQKAEGATFLDDIDIFPSPIDGQLITCALKGGRRVCWQCGELFDDSSPKLKGVETQIGYGRVLLHARCTSGKPTISSYWNIVRGLQVRRFFASATKHLAGIVKE